MSDSIFCSRCGQRLPQNINFCPYCGNRLAQAAKGGVAEPCATKDALRSAFYVFAVQGPAFGMAPSGDLVLEKANKLKENYEAAKDMPLKLIRPNMWDARVQGGSASGVVSVSYSMEGFKDKIRGYLGKEGYADILIEEGIALSDEHSLQLSNPMSGIFVMGIPIVCDEAPTKEEPAAEVTEETLPAACSHEYRHFTCTKCGEKAPKPLLVSLGKSVQDQYTYEYYRASSAEEAKYFLEQTAVTQPLYYVMVETPEGKWGRDKDGIFLERLCDFQRNPPLAQCQAKTAVFPYRMEDLQMAANKITDNYLLSVSCGSCGYEWLDGVAYRAKTVVRCPECGKYNLVDTNGIHFNDF